MPSRKLIPSITGFVAILAVTTACGVAGAEPGAPPTGIPSATEPTSRQTATDDPTAQTRTEAQRILDIAHANILEAGSFLVDIEATNVHGDSTSTVRSSLAVAAPDQVTGTETRGSRTVEVIFVNGQVYERPTEPPDHAWFSGGSADGNAVQGIYDLLLSIEDPVLVSTEVVDGKTVHKITGGYSTFLSGPPPPAGFEYRWHDSATALIDAVTLLPIALSAEFSRELVEVATGEVTPFIGWSSAATFSEYGSVDISVEEPTNLVPTPSPPTPTSAPPTATPTDFAAPSRPP